MKFKNLTKHGLQGTPEFTMHGIQLRNKMHHAPTIVHTFASQEELESLKEKISNEFGIVIDNSSTLKTRIYLLESHVYEEDIKFWHENKNRFLIKQTPVLNHYKIPLFYSIFGLMTTVLLVFPELKELPVLLLDWIQHYQSKI